MSIAISSLRPDELGRESLDDVTTLVLGAPHIGKTTRFEQLDATVFETLPDPETAPAAEPIVIDDFYEAYQAAPEARQSTIEQLLTRSGGVCLSTRPRSLDWLLEQGDGPIGELLNLVDQVVLLRYDPESDREKALDRCVRIGTNTEAGDEEGGIDRAAVADDIEKITYDGYTFDNDRLAALIGEYEPSVVPSLVVYFSETLEAGRSILSREGVRAACSDLLSNLTFAEGYDRLSESVGAAWEAIGLGDVLDTDITNTLAARLGSVDPTEVVGPGLALSMLGSAPAMGAGLLLVSVGAGALGRDGSGEQLLDRIISEELTPAAKEELEQQLNLPPLTIDRLSRLTETETQRTLAALSEFEAAELRELRATLEEREAQHERLTAAVEQLNANEEAAETYAAFVSRHFQRAARDLDWLGDQLIAEEQALLSGMLDESFSVEQIPHYQSTDDAGSEVTQNRVDQVASAAQTGGVVVLRGSHGTGKTTTAYKALTRLPDSYAVRIPELQDGSGFVEEILRTHVHADEIVLYTSYSPAEAGWISHQEHLKTLFEWLANGLCTSVLIECRSEQFPEFKNTANNVAGVVRGRLWDDRTVVGFESFDQKVDTRQLVQWVANLADWDGDMNAAVDAIEDVARGNPEITKLAARFVINDRSISEIATADVLIREDIRHFFAADSGAAGRQWRVFTRLAVAGGLTTGQLVEITGFDRTELRECAVQLAGYLNQEVSEAINSDTSSGLSTSRKGLSDDTTWRISPDIYSDVVLRYCLDDGNPELSEPDTFDKAFEELFNRDNEYSYDGLLPSIASNLAATHRNVVLKIANQEEVQIDADLESFRHTVLNKSNSLLQELFNLPCEPGMLTASIRSLAFGRVPFDPELLITNSEQVFNDADAADDVFEYGAEGTMENIISSLKLAHLIMGDAEPAGLTDIDQAFAEYVESPANFLENIYSMTILEFADVYSNPNNVRKYINSVEQWAITTAADDVVHDDLPAQFLMNMYAMAISGLSERYPNPESAGRWFNDIERRAIATASDDSAHDFTTGQFLVGMYTMAIAGIAESHPNPETAKKWLNDTEQRAVTMAEHESVHNHSTAGFLKKFYGMSLSKPYASQLDLQAATEWVNVIEQHAIATATDQSMHDARPDEFLVTIYSTALLDLADTYSDPTVAEEWFNTIEQRTIATANDSSLHNFPPGRFIENVYSGAVADLRQIPTIETHTEWLTAIEERAIKTATDSSVHNDTPGEFLINFYAIALTKLVDTYPQPSAVVEWFKTVEHRAVETATNDSVHEFPPSRFLSATFSTIISNIATPDSDPSEFAEWIGFIERRIIALAENHSDDLDAHSEMTVQFYALSVSNLASRYPDPNEISEWVKALENRVSSVATDNAIEPIPAEFIGDYFAHALASILSDSKPVALTPWAQSMLSRALRSQSHETLVHLYNTLQQAVKSVDTGIQILDDLVNRVTSDDPPCELRERRVTVVAVAVARLVRVFELSGIPWASARFHRLLMTLEGLVTNEDLILIDILERTVELLDDSPCEFQLGSPPLSSLVARDAFIERALGHGLAQAASSNPKHIPDLLDTLVSLAALTDHPAEIYIDAVTRGASIEHATPTEAATLVETVAYQLVCFANPPFARQDRVAALASVSAGVLSRIPTDSTSEPPFSRIIDSINAVEDVDQDFRNQVAKEVGVKLESSTYGFDIPTATAWRETIDF